MNQGPQTAEKKNVMIALPSYDGRAEVGTMFAITRASQKPEHHVVVRTAETSSLTRAFNTLYAEALSDRKHGLTHFAMIHADVVPEHDWLDKMLEIMDREKADVLSAVIPIKSTEGYVSTAIDEADGAPMGSSVHYAVSNLNLRELYRMKEATFTDENILLNTGLMVIDMRKPWVEELCFRFENEIVKMPDGTFKAFELTEDWYFSREAKRLGAKLYATREVRVKHLGRAAYGNFSPWGTVGVEKK